MARLACEGRDGRVADLVLRLAEDEPEQAGLLAEALKGFTVVDLEGVTVLRQEGGPVVAHRGWARGASTGAPCTRRPS